MLYRSALAVCAFLCVFLFVMAAHAERGIASYYDCRQPGECSKSKRTASGQKFNPNILTAAHKTLQLGTRVEVTNLRNHRRVVVRIVDRGPFVRGRVIDLTPAAARAIRMGGLAPVSLRIIP